jgi:hypothetical protein
VAAMVRNHVSAESAPERTIDDIKVATQVHAERGAYPLTGLDPTEVRDACRISQHAVATSGCGLECGG